MLIPKEARTPILKELHSTHRGHERIKNIFSERFFWSRINVERTHHKCEGCQREAVSKIKKKCEVTAPNLTQMAPA